MIWSAQNCPKYPIHMPAHMHTCTHTQRQHHYHFGIQLITSSFPSSQALPHTFTSRNYPPFCGSALWNQSGLNNLVTFLSFLVSPSDQLRLALCSPSAPSKSDLRLLCLAPEDWAPSLLLSQTNTILPTFIPDPDDKTQNAEYIKTRLESNQVRNQSSVHRTLKIWSPEFQGGIDNFEMKPDCIISGGRETLKGQTHLYKQRL